MTRRATGWGYWINGSRIEDAAWSFEQAAAQAGVDLDTWMDA